MWSLLIFLVKLPICSLTGFDGDVDFVDRSDDETLLLGSAFLIGDLRGEMGERLLRGLTETRRGLFLFVGEIRAGDFLSLLRFLPLGILFSLLRGGVFTRGGSWDACTLCRTGDFEEGLSFCSKAFLKFSFSSSSIFFSSTLSSSSELLASRI